MLISFQIMLMIGNTYEYSDNVKGLDLPDLPLYVCWAGALSDGDVSPRHTGENVVESERGYTSDSELYAAGNTAGGADSSTSNLTTTTSNTDLSTNTAPDNSWILVRRIHHMLSLCMSPITLYTKSIYWRQATPFSLPEVANFKISWFHCIFICLRETTVVKIEIAKFTW